MLNNILYTILGYFIGMTFGILILYILSNIKEDGKH